MSQVMAGVAGDDEATGDVAMVQFEATRAGVAGVRTSELLPLVARGTLIQLCLWGDDSSITDFRARLTRVARTQALYDSIIKIERVLQPNGRSRFDLFLSPNAARRLQDLIRCSRRAKQYGWHCRPHKSYRDRHPRGVPVPRTTTAHIPPPTRVTVPPREEENRGTLTVGTYNVNGLRGKRTDLRVFLHETKLDVLGIQETMLGPTDWRLRMPGYACFFASGHGGTATRGVGLIVSQKFSSMAVGPPSAYWVFARLMGGDLQCPVLVGSVYVPHANTRNRREVLRTLPLAVSRLKQQFQNDPIILAGDFNTTLQPLQQRMALWPIQLQVLPHTGEGGTHARGRTIDHISYWGTPDNRPVPPTRVLRDWDLSDHLPVVGEIPYLRDRQVLDGPPPGGKPRRILVRVPEVRPKIATSNYWEPLAREFETIDDPAELCTQWEATCHTVASTLQLHAPQGHRNVSLSKSACRAVLRRRRRYRQLQRTRRRGRPPDIAVAEAAYTAAKSTCRQALRRAGNKRWHKAVKLAHAQLLYRPKEFWKWSSRVAGWRGKDQVAGVQPVYHEETRVLLTSLQDITAAWGRHYASLASDPTGHSQSEAHWQHIRDTPQHPELKSLNEKITRREVWNVLRRMKLHKAPGTDGIPTDFIRACLWERPELVPEGDPPPPTDMTDALTRFLNVVYASGVLPPGWTTSTVVSLPKEGDLADMDNYRGISLMSCTLKVLLVILSIRLNVAGEEANLFHETQAGFRSKEEAITQAACVIEALQRRRIAGWDTYAIFIDLRKAYDTVPHQALFAKLRRFGVQGRCLHFIQQLYAASTLSVRVGMGATAQYSDPEPLLRGVRQG